MVLEKNVDVASLLKKYNPGNHKVAVKMHPRENNPTKFQLSGHTIIADKIPCEYLLLKQPPSMGMILEFSTVAISAMLITPKKKSLYLALSESFEPDRKAFVCDNLNLVENLQ